MISSVVNEDGSITVEIKPEQGVIYAKCISLDVLGGTIIAECRGTEGRLFDVLNNKLEKQLSAVELISLGMTYQVTEIIGAFSLTLNLRETQ